MEIYTNGSKSSQKSPNPAKCGLCLMAFFSPCYLIGTQLGTEGCTGETEAPKGAVDCTKAFLQSQAWKRFIFQTLPTVL